MSLVRLVTGGLVGLGTACGLALGRGRRILCDVALLCRLNFRFELRRATLPLLGLMLIQV